MGVRYQIMSNGTHLGTIIANDQNDAIDKARQAFPGTPGLQVESDASSAVDRANPISPSETLKALHRMTGAGKGMGGIGVK